MCSRSAEGPKWEEVIKINRALGIIFLSAAICTLVGPATAAAAGPPASPGQSQVAAFRKTACQDYMASLICPTGLVASRWATDVDHCECFTTVYKNSLAAFAFVHERRYGEARSIFDFFQDRIETPFVGFHQAWNPCTGEAFTSSDRWVGDNAFLLLALNYYVEKTHDETTYSALVGALKSWLAAEGATCAADGLIAEGAANMYASLAPHPDVDPLTLAALRGCFESNVNYECVGDHLNRGSLVFGDLAGFESVADFIRTENWDVDGSEVTALAAFNGESHSPACSGDGEDFINVEISAQNFAAWRIWKNKAKKDIDLSFLEAELMKLQIPPPVAAGEPVGLPYYVTTACSCPCGDCTCCTCTRGFCDDSSRAIIDSTAWMCFYLWRFNPYAPGKRALD